MIWFMRVEPAQFHWNSIHLCTHHIYVRKSSLNYTLENVNSSFQTLQPTWYYIVYYVILYQLCDCLHISANIHEDMDTRMDIWSVSIVIGSYDRDNKWMIQKERRYLDHGVEQRQYTKNMRRISYCWFCIQTNLKLAHFVMAIYTTCIGSNVL